MKTGRKIFVLLIIIVLLVIAVGAIFSLSGGDSKTFSADLYFINKEKSSIYSESREIKYEYRRDLPELVVTELSKGPRTEGADVIPEKVSWYISKKASRVMVDFSDEFLTNNRTQNMLATYAVVKTLCGIDGVDAVKVTVEGEELVGLDNVPIGYLSKSDIDIEQEEGITHEKSVRLYFLNEFGTLDGEWREINITDTVPLAESLITELIKGPKEEGNIRTLSQETKLISVDVAEEVAYVNMSANFIEKNKGDSKREWAAVYSIVNTLFDSLPDINGVQFLIEGKKEVGFETVDLTNLFPKTS